MRVEGDSILKAANATGISIKAKVSEVSFVVSFFPAYNSPPYIYLSIYLSPTGESARSLVLLPVSRATDEATSQPVSQPTRKAHHRYF